MKHILSYCKFVSSYFLIALTISGCTKPVNEPALRPVRAIKIGDMQVFQGRGYPGRAEAGTEVELAFRISGPLVALPVRVGDMLKKGDLVAAIDPTDFQTTLELAKGNLERANSQLLAMERGARAEEIEQFQAALAEAQAVAAASQAEFERNSELLPSKAISKSEYDLSLAQRDRTAARVKSAKATLQIGQVGARQEDLQAKRGEIQALQATVTDAENRLRYTRLLAPFDSQVAARYVENYQNIQASQAIVRLLDSSKIKVTVQIPESAISLVPLVEDVTCQFDALPDRDFPGQIIELGTEASQATRTYPVTVGIDQPPDVTIHPGMAGRVRANLRDAESEPPIMLVVPIDAVFAWGGEKQSHVWVLDEPNQTVTRRPVITGELTPGGIRIIKGLDVGQWVVTAGVQTLQEGQKIRHIREGGE